METAKSVSLCAAGQAWLKQAVAGNVRGMGAAVVELEFQERPDNPFPCFRPIRGLQPASIPGLCRPHDNARPDALAEYGDGLSLRHQGRGRHCEVIA
jgi:hypothetical protein